MNPFIGQSSQSIPESMIPKVVGFTAGDFLVLMRKNSEVVLIVRFVFASFEGAPVDYINRRTIFQAFVSILDSMSTKPVS